MRHVHDSLPNDHWGNSTLSSGKDLDGFMEEEDPNGTSEGW